MKIEFLAWIALSLLNTNGESFMQSKAEICLFLCTRVNFFLNFEKRHV